MKNSLLLSLPIADRVAAGDEPGNNAAYEEYLRGFDEIPVLQDAVRIPPPRPQPPDFRRGERRDVRHETRPDAYSLRETNVAEIALLYDEYSQPAPARAVRAKAKKKSTKPKAKRTTKKPARA
jgi:hypothetical protein